jgi:formamidopyrimidine-DNA glycosylase
MPELPEVEHAARLLRRWLRGRVVRRAEAESTRIFRGSDPARFEAELRGRRLERLERRGKYLLFAFDGDVGLLSHLGMTGKWVRSEPGEPPPSHSRARLLLDDRRVVHYRDPRLFGQISLHPAGALENLPEIRALGADPVRDGVDPARLGDALGHTRRAVKVALLDGRIVAGVGNIQATEALFRARIHPARPGRSLSAKEVKALARGVEASIELTLARLGGKNASRPATYVEEDHSQNPFLVYGRAGSPCPRCGTVLLKMQLGGRGSTYCPRCQPRGSRR